ncbi:hypothetical protein [Nonomuraea sp. NPDC002799]
MLVILAIAAIAILACVVLVSLGRGGELTEFPPDVPPLDLPEAGQLSAVDFMALQLPVNLVGYHTQSVDETLRRAANAISARDTRIAVLEQRLSELLSSRLHARQEVYAAPGAGLRTDHEPEAPAAPRELPESGDPMTSSGASVAWDGDVAPLRHRPEEPDWRVPSEDGLAAAAQDGHEAPELDADPEVASGDGPGVELRDGEHAEEPKPDDEPQAELRDDGLKDDGLKDDGLKDDGAEPGEPQDTNIAEEPVRASLGKDGKERT